MGCLRKKNSARQCRRTALTSPDVDAQGLMDGLPCLAESMGEVGVAGAEPLPDSPLFKRAFTSDLANRSRSAALENRPAVEHSWEKCVCFAAHRRCRASLVTGVMTLVYCCCNVCEFCSSALLNRKDSL